jgi:hypothetical protein
MKLKIIAYKTESGIWAFDHEHQNTVAEALCNGTETVIDWYYEMLNETKPVTGDKIQFYLDTDKFDYTTTEINLIKTDEFGSVYKDKMSSMELWLCPWLQGYFGEVPETIYIHCDLHHESLYDPEFEELLDIIIAE